MALQTFTAGQVLTAAQMTSLQANGYNQTVSTKTASYTLVAADKGTRVVMNSASATTITVNTSLFSAGDTLFLQNISTGVCTVTAGTATVATAGSLAIPQNGSGILYFTSAGVSIYYPSAVTASTPGLVCVKAETAFTTASSVTVDNVFTSAYTNYKIMFRQLGTSNTTTEFRLRVGGVNATGSNYNQQRLSGGGSTASALAATGQGYFQVLGPSGAFICSHIFELFSPAEAAVTTFLTQQVKTDGAYTVQSTESIYGNHTLTTAYDGFAFQPQAGTVTGTYTVYGYSKAV